MRTFEHFNQTGDNLCPICGTNDDKPVVLIPILGTEDGHNIQAIQVHDDCLSQNLVYSNEIIPHLIFAVANK